MICASRRSSFGKGFFAPQRGIADEDVDSAELFYCRVSPSPGICRGGVSNVADMDQRLAALGLTAARPPRPRRGLLRGLTTIDALSSRQRASAMARPILRPAPVMMATLPVSSLLVIRTLSIRHRPRRRTIQ